jgi:hypothetical protein
MYIILSKLASTPQRCLLLIYHQPLGLRPVKPCLDKASKTRLHLMMAEEDKSSYMMDMHY